MCLILFGYHSHPRYRLVLAANRDEFYDRPTAPMDFWEDQPQILAGRDLKMMGTWFGITRSGRIAAITNYRQPDFQIDDAPSRGHLISDFLSGGDSPAGYLRDVASRAKRYNGFNLLVGDVRSLHYYSNRAAGAKELSPGIYGLSNHLLDTDWPKVSHGKAQLEAHMGNAHLRPGDLLDLLRNRDLPPDDHLPDTGIGREWERILAPMFISSPGYGTRASTLVTIDLNGRVEIVEVTWQPGQESPEAVGRQSFTFTIEAD